MSYDTLPFKAQFYLRKAIRLSQVKEHGAAIPYFQSALNEAEHPLLYSDIGSSYFFLNQLDKAIDYFQQGLLISPDSDLLWRNLGCVHRAALRYEEAINCFKRSIEINPDYNPAYEFLGTTYLTLENYRDGFQAFESRISNLQLQSIRFPNSKRWKGQEFKNQTLLICSEGGLGDSIFFLRYLPLVKSLGGTIILEIQERLIDIAKGIKGVDQCLAHGSNIPSFDYFVSLASLPYIFNTLDKESIPQSPYIKSNEKIELKGQYKIGLVWAGNPDNTIDFNRSCSFENYRHFIEPFNVSQSIQFYSLQMPNSNQEELQQHNIIDLIPSTKSMVDTVNQIEALDLIITIDTAVANLAGSMGKRSLLLLSYSHDWRWHKKERSPWYPNTAIIRQKTDHDWLPVMMETKAFIDKQLRTRDA
jgi:tetratricopeptide (TPR) repeat protein